MTSKLKYILVLLFSLHAVNIFSKDINVDEHFTSIDIYNSLLNDSTSHDDIVLDIFVKNKTDEEQQLYLSIINPTIDNIVIKEDTNIVILGDVVRFTQRKFKHNNHVYPFLLKQNESKRINIKILKQWQAVNFRVNLSSENTFIKTTNHDNFFMGIFYGIVFMYLLLLICFYIFSKSNFFIIYLTINSFMVLIFFQYSGIGYQFMWFFSASIQKYITVFAVIGYFTAHMYFIRSFFTLQFKTNFSGFLLKTFIVILVLFGIITLMQLYNRSYGYILPNMYYLLINGSFLLYGLMVIALCIYTYYESKRRETIWVLIGMLLHISNWMIFINNEYAMLKPLNYLADFKFFPSNNFVPQTNFIITMLEVFVITVFISINYHKLIKQNNISTQRLDFLQKRNINTFVVGQEDEREKISAQIGTAISDDILQLKKSLLQLQQHDEKKIIPVVLNDIDKTLEDIKNITSNYVAPNMQQMKLAELISTATEKIFTETDLQYDFSKIPVNFQLNAVANINLYRVMQEISNNILKHAYAANVTISAIKDSKTLQIKITDDGVGFTDFAPKSKGIGLMNIESRMTSLNGNFYVLSNVQKGSTIHLIMPLKDIS